MSLLRSSAALVVVALAAGCSGSATGSPDVHGRAPALDGCVRRDAATSIVQVRGSGERFPAAVMGRGSTGVVLANESDLDLCAWLPLAHTLSRWGTRVLLFDYRVATPQSEVAAAARRLRKAGVRRVVLIGASEGAKAAIIAAAHDPRLADGLVALSPERELGSTNVMPSARALRVPALFAVARHDPFSGLDTPALARAASVAGARLVEVPGDQHGVALLHGPSAATVAAAVYTFLQRFQASPPRPEPRYLVTGRGWWPGVRSCGSACRIRSW
jgi:pimeloyl-ACP methyl ester carboxylesterase